MKITPADFALLSSSLAKIPDADILAHAEALPTSERPPKNLAMRVRWDCFWLARKKEDSLRAMADRWSKEGVNDDHIDTALRRVMRERGLPQFAV